MAFLDLAISQWEFEKCLKVLLLNITPLITKILGLYFIKVATNAALHLDYTHPGSAWVIVRKEKKTDRSNFIAGLFYGPMYPVVTYRMFYYRAIIRSKLLYTLFALHFTSFISVLRPRCLSLLRVLNIFCYCLNAKL